ncbi:MAG TPA: copper chaperone PCu(A)C [Burkholderiales bacterium]
MKNTLRALALTAFGFVVVAPAWSQVTVTDAWVRGTVPSQTVTGAFMNLHSAKDAAVVSVESPAAGTVEIHEMRMENDVARMRHTNRLPLSAGQTVELRPGGYHLMLIDLKQALKAGDSVPLTLKIEQRDGSVQKIAVEASVRALGSVQHGHDSHGRH